MSNPNDTKPKLFEEFPPVPTETWMAAIEKDLKGADFEKALMWKSPEGVRTKPFYRKEDSARLDGQWDTVPGEAPFARGTHCGTNRWQIRQDVVSGNPAEANAQALTALQKGADRIGFVSQPTREGVRGVFVQTQSDMAALLQGIHLEMAPIDLEVGSLAEQTALLFANEVERRKLDPQSATGAIGFDPLIDYALGTREFKSEGSFRGTVQEHLKLSGHVLPNMEALVLHAGTFREAGGDIAQELGFALAMAVEYFSCAKDLPELEAMAAKMRVSLSVGSNFFFEIAKLRAFRLVWTQMMKGYGASDAAPAVSVHSQTALWNKTIFDPYTNMLRVTTEAMSAAIGGTDSLSVTPFDMAYESPSDFAQRIARNTQIVAQNEAYLGQTQDPAGGSYYLESLTDALANKAWAVFQKTDAEGGFLRSLENGTVQQAIGASREEKDKLVSQRRIVLVGTNNYPNLKETMLDKVAKPEAEPMALSPVPPGPTFEPIEPYRVAEPYENLRLSVERNVAKGGKRPVVFLLTVGSVGMRKARANFIQNLMGCAGFAIYEGPGYPDATKGLEAAYEVNADVVVLCSSDDEYATFGPELGAAAAKSGKKPILVIAGSPKEHLETLDKAGIDDYIHVRSNALETLTKYVDRLVGKGEGA